jgi:hypothetical protein
MFRYSYQNPGGWGVGVGLGLGGCSNGVYNFDARSEGRGGRAPRPPSVLGGGPAALRRRGGRSGPRRRAAGEAAGAGAAPFMPASTTLPSLVRKPPLRPPGLSDASCGAAAAGFRGRRAPGCRRPRGRPGPPAGRGARGQRGPRARSNALKRARAAAAPAASRRSPAPRGAWRRQSRPSRLRFFRCWGGSLVAKLALQAAPARASRGPRGPHLRSRRPSCRCPWAAPRAQRLQQRAVAAARRVDRAPPQGASRTGARPTAAGPVRIALCWCN